MVVTGRMQAGCIWLSDHDQGGNMTAATVTFPVQFPSMALVAWNNPKDTTNDDTIDYQEIGIWGLSTTGYSCRKMYGGITRWWCAIGY